MRRIWTKLSDNVKSSRILCATAAFDDREVDVAEVLLSRNRNRNAVNRAADLAAVVDDENDWANNFRAHHLGKN